LLSIPNNIETGRDSIYTVETIVDIIMTRASYDEKIFLCLRIKDI